MDNESATNILFLNAYMEMGIKESNMAKKSVSLVGFSVESRNTIREVVFPVHTEGVNLHTKFLVLENPSAYNIIIG